MKQTKKLAMVLVFSLTLAQCLTESEAQAAKTPKLSKKKVTLSVGKTAKIKVKNIKAKKVKKMTVKVNKKKVVTVKKSGKTVFTIKGKKVGKAVITVKVKTAKKTTTRKVKVTVKRVEKDEKETPSPTATPNGVATNAPTATPSVTPAVTPQPTPLINYTETFDTNAGLWFAKSGSEITISEEAHTGSGALLVSGGRGGTKGICIDLTNRIQWPVLYTLTFWAKAPVTNLQNQGRVVELHVNASYRTSANSELVTESYAGGTTYSLSSAEWTLVELEFATPTDAIDYTLNIETAGNEAGVFMIDDICIKRSPVPR